MSFCFTIGTTISSSGAVGIGKQKESLSCRGSIVIDAVLNSYGADAFMQIILMGNKHLGIGNELLTIVGRKAVAINHT